MSNTAFVVDDSLLGEVIVSQCGVPTKHLVRALDSLTAEDVNDAVNIMVHLSHSKGQRISIPGLETAHTLRRDHRYNGGITLYSIESLEQLAAKHPATSYLRSENMVRWNFQLFQLPEQQRELMQAFYVNRRLSSEEIDEFVLQCCALNSYFSTSWSAVAHWLQGGYWRDRLATRHFKTILTNSKHYGPLLLRQREQSPAVPPKDLKSALTSLAMASEGNALPDEESVRAAVCCIQSWLLGTGADVYGRAVIPEKAIEDCSLILIADDDGYDASGLEALNYRVLANVTSPEQVRDELKEQPHIFLCDLRWGEGSHVGLDLVKDAVECGVPVVILMSVGSTPANLPDSVITCTGLSSKSNAAYIHKLIVNAWTKIAKARGV